MCEKRYREAVVAIFALLALFSLSCSPRPNNVVKSYVRAYNVHDLEKLLALYSEEVRFELVGQVLLQGKEELRALAEHDFALNIHMTLGECRLKGDSVMYELTETNDWLKAAGIEKARYSGAFVVRDGLIESIRAKQAPETERAFREVLRPLLAWASEHRPQLVAEMMPEGRFIYNAENARKSLLLLGEWREVLQKKEDSPIWKRIGG